MNQLTEIQSMLELHPDGKVVFKECIPVNLSPQHIPFDIWGAWLGPQGIFLMDCKGVWYGPLQEDQVNAIEVITSLFNRLKSMTHAGAVTN